MTTELPDSAPTLDTGVDGGRAGKPAIDYTLTLTPSESEVLAEGQTIVSLTVETEPPISGRVVLLTSSKGLLATTSLELVEGLATALWWAPRDDELGAADSVVVSFTGEVRFDVETTLTASASLTATAPPQGVPVLELEPLITTGTADGTSAIEIQVKGRRMEPGTLVTLSTDLGTLSSASVELDDDLLATVSLTSLAEGTAHVSALAGDTSASAEVSFLAVDAAQFDLNGTWAQLGIGRVKLVSDTLDPSPQCVLAPSVTLIEVVQGELDVMMTSVTCSLVMPAVDSTAGLTQTTPGPGFLDAIGSVVSLGTLESLELGAELQGDELINILGADLPNPAGELPTVSTNPAVVDEDNDGNPGVTVLLTGTPFGIGDGEQYIVNRTRTQTRGRVTSSIQIDGSELGSLISFSETAVLDSALANNFAPLASGIPSIFSMKRVDGAYGAIDIADRDGDPTSISCADVLSAQALLFADFASPVTPKNCAGL